MIKLKYCKLEDYEQLYKFMIAIYKHMYMEKYIMEQDVQHVFLVGAKSLGKYGGYETFINKLTEYHQNNSKIKYHIACKANGDGYMDETKLDGVKVVSDTEFIYHNAQCFKIHIPKIGPAQAILYDIAALNICYKYIKDNIGYGNTIINMAASDSKFKIASYMAAKNNNIKVRILKIVDFDKVYSPRPAVFFIMLATVISFISLFCINTFGYTSPYYLDNVNYTQNNFEEFFEGKKGTFVLYDTNKQKYTIYNEDMARKRVSPCSTYKIAMALNGLEEGVITGNKNKMSWDGVTNPFEEWNKDQNLDSAMKNSVNWYFKNIDKKLSIREIRDFLNKTDYGNKSVIYDKENYWLENSLEISPLEQVIFLNRVVNNDFGFSDENIYTVLNSLKISDCIYGKTGTGMVNGKIVGGWFVSLVESQNNRYVIATRVEYATGAEAEDITMNILDKMNILDSSIL